jgi:drug/metabolite transporter (DMT)-like permease
VGTLLALLSSALWGTSDFLGGTASRRLSPIGVVAISEAFGLLGVFVVAVATGALTASPGYVGWALLAAASGTAGILAFYQALATGTMGVVAPIAALGVAVPVLVGIVGGDRPTAAQGVGLVVAIAGVVLAGGPEVTAADRPRHVAIRPLLLAVVAAIGFGIVFVAIDRGARTSTIMTLVVMRAASVVILLAVAAMTSRSVLAVGVGALPTLAVIGGFDVGANAAFGYASRHGLLSLVSVLSSLYPAVTAVLARVIHAERLRSVQLVGVCAALTGVALIASAGVG